MDRFRIGSYNTLNGGRDRDGSHHRWQAQMDMLRSLDLDVLCLQEGKRWDEEGGALVNATAAALEMEARITLSASHACHLVTLVRLPRVRYRRYYADIAEGNFHHGMSRADLQVQGVDWDLRVLNTHLDPFDPDDRAREAKWLTEFGFRNDTILAGDLNSEAPGDPEPASWDWLPPHLHSRHRAQNADGSYGGVDKRAMQALLTAGFIDPIDHLRLPFARTAGYWDDAERRDHRSDYVLPSGHLPWRLLSYAVEDTPHARRAGDHLPVIATFQL